MSNLIWLLIGVVGTILVEFVVVVGIAVRRLIKSSGQDSKEPIKENIVPVLRKG